MAAEVRIIFYRIYNTFTAFQKNLALLGQGIVLHQAKKTIQIILPQ
jgi:hypothetical protein